MTIGQQVSTNASVKFNPYIKMTYKGIDDTDKTEVYVLSEFQREIRPNDYVEVSWTQSPNNLLIQSQMWSLDNALTNGDKGWNNKNSVLKGGALYSITTPATQTVTLTTYQTIVEGESRDISTIAPANALTYTGAVTAHNDFVTSAVAILETAEVRQYVNKDPLAETAWDGGIEVYSGASLSGLSNGSPTASTDEKYYLRDGGGTNSNLLIDSSLNIGQSSLPPTFYRFYSDAEGNIYMATSTTLDGAKTATSSTPILNKTEDANDLTTSGADGTALTLNYRTGVVTKLLATLERNTGDDPSASWAEDDGHWYNEAYTGIIILKQSTRISIF